MCWADLGSAMSDRYVMPSAIATLARRFGLPVSDSMQDWAWEVSDPARLDDFLNTYEKAALSDDERFALMEMILQSFEDRDADPVGDSRWSRVLECLQRNLELHSSSIKYWASLEAKSGISCRHCVSGHQRTACPSKEAGLGLAAQQADAADEVRDGERSARPSQLIRGVLRPWGWLGMAQERSAPGSSAATLSSSGTCTGSALRAIVSPAGEGAFANASQ